MFVYFTSELRNTFIWYVRLNSNKIHKHLLEKSENFCTVCHVLCTLQRNFDHKLTSRKLSKGAFFFICSRFPRRGSGLGPGGKRCFFLFLLEKPQRKTKISPARSSVAENSIIVPSSHSAQPKLLDPRLSANGSYIGDVVCFRLSR